MITIIMATCMLIGGGLVGYIIGHVHGERLTIHKMWVKMRLVASRTKGREVGGSKTLLAVIDELSKIG